MQTSPYWDEIRAEARGEAVPQARLLAVDGWADLLNGRITSVVEGIPVCMRRILKSLALVLACSVGVTAGRAAAQDPMPAPTTGAAMPQSEFNPARRGSAQPSEAGESSATSEPGSEATPERGEDRIETDRDAFTPATRLVGKGLFILESAYSFIDNRGVPDTHSFPEMLLRFGLLERLEVRLGWNYEVGGTGNDVSGQQGGEEFDVKRLLRETRINYGVKAALTKQDGWQPDSIVIAEVFTPTSGPDPATQIAITAAGGWQLPNRWRLDGAMRYATNSEAGDHFNVWAPSVVLRVPIGERWGVHAEYFGLFSQNQAHDFVHHFFSPGFRYLVNRNLELGVRVGWGLNDQTSRFFTNAGFGWRF
jgi:hypothetical protein